MNGSTLTKGPTPAHDTTGLEPKETRLGFRIAAGVISAMLILVTPPMAMSGALGDPVTTLVLAAVTLYAGVGMGLAAWTGKWMGRD